MNKISNLLWGLFFIGIGMVFGLNALGITDINIFFDGWWTLFIIVPCFIGIFKDEDKTGNLIGLVIGLFLLLGCQKVIRFVLVWKLMIPIILVIIGITFIFKDIFNSKIKKEMKKLNKNETKEYCSCFSSQTIDFNNETFNGCSISAIFGEVKCDLTNATIKEDSVINANSIFGGITIYAPKDINIKISSTSIFGGASDERKTKIKDAKQTIYINVTSIFGGVDIK